MDIRLDDLLDDLERTVASGQPEEIAPLLSEVVFAAQLAASVYLNVWTSQRRERTSRLAEEAKEALRGTPYEERAATRASSLPDVAA